jgi:hypothetical protein
MDVEAPTLTGELSMRTFPPRAGLVLVEEVDDDGVLDTGNLDMDAWDAASLRCFASVSLAFACSSATLKPFLT